MYRRGRANALIITYIITHGACIDTLLVVITDFINGTLASILSPLAQIVLQPRGMEQENNYDQ